jgi:aldose 1-epimerase
MKIAWTRWFSIVLSGALLLALGCSAQSDKATPESPPTQTETAAVTPPTQTETAAETPPTQTEPAAVTPPTQTETTAETPPTQTEPAAETPPTQTETAAETPPTQTETASPTTPNTTESEKNMSIQKEPYGKMPDGTQVDLYTLTNAHGLKVKLITYGATIVEVDTPDRDGKMDNINLFRDSLEDYMKADTPYFGCTVGRYGNRIAKGKFTLDGKEYTLAKNNGENALHGGLKGFDKVVWKAEPVESKDSVGVKFTYVSPDGEEGYPGTLTAQVTYSLNNQNELKMEYTATTDKPTVVNLTNHCYWNLSGAGSGDVLGEEMMINADGYLPVDEGLIPLGKIEPVKGTPMDFTSPMTIGSRIDQVKTGDVIGYDHCYVLNKSDGSKLPGYSEPLTLAAKVVDPKSGRVMEVYTTEPAVQFYTGNFLDGTISGGGKKYEKHAAFCLETQHYPDSPNQPNFPSTVLRPGETYKHFTMHKFNVE